MVTKGGTVVTSAGGVYSLGREYLGVLEKFCISFFFFNKDF